MAAPGGADLTWPRHAIKIKFPGGKRWEFITPDGGTTHLRVHAATMTEERATEVASKIPTNNEGVQAKAVKL